MQMMQCIDMHCFGASLPTLEHVGHSAYEAAWGRWLRVRRNVRAAFAPEFFHCERCMTMLTLYIARLGDARVYLSIPNIVVDVAKLNPRKARFWRCGCPTSIQLPSRRLAPFHVLLLSLSKRSTPIVRYKVVFGWKATELEIITLRRPPSPKRD